MGSLPGAVPPFNAPYGLSNYGPWSPVFINQTPPIAVAAATLGTITVPASPAFNSLLIMMTITGFSGSDQAALRFNADSGANYVTRFITAVAGGVVLVDNPSASATLLRVTALAATTGGNVVVKIVNQAAVSKMCLIQNTLNTGAAATAPTAVLSGSGEWVNTTSAITSIQALIVGANNYSAGSSMTVWGLN